MKRINKENGFLITWLMCVMILLGACNLGFLKETWSAFGNITGQLTVPYSMNYYSNYPDELGLDEGQRTESVVGKIYTIMVNVFEASGYEFVSWNTSVDGTGEVYNPNESIALEKNLTLYAQWKKVLVVTISYGDVNTDGVVNSDDYLLIEQSVSSGTQLTGQGLLNADVNVDGKVDLVDVDIIKQVSLGTEGYVGILPNSPLLVYEMYNDVVDSDDGGNDDDIEPDENDGTDDNTSNDDVSSGENEMDGNITSGSSYGNGNSSGGGSSSSSGTGGNGSSSSNVGHGGNSSSSSSSKPSNDDNPSDNEENSDDSLLKENTDSEIIDNNLENAEDNNLIERDNKECTNQQKGKNYSLYGVIVVFCIFILAIRLIIYVICKFRKKENNSKI